MTIFLNLAQTVKFQASFKCDDGYHYFLPPNATALCAVRKVYFSAQPNNLKLILNFQKYYPIEHIFVPACSSARKEHFFKF